MRGGSVLQSGLDALWRRIVVAVHPVGVARVVFVLRRTVVVVEVARGGDVDYRAVAHGERAVAFHSLATRAGSCERDVAPGYVDVAVRADAAGRLCVEVVGVPCAVARGGYVDCSAADEYVALCFCALCSCTGTVDVDSSARDVYVARVFVFVVGGLSGAGCAVKVALHTVVGSVLYVHRSALHEEVLVARDAVAHSREHVYLGIFHRDILASLYGVLGVSGDVERTFLLELGVSLHVEAALLASSADVGEGVGGAFGELYVDALAVLYVDGRSAIHCGLVGQREAVEHESGLVRARHIETAVSRRAAERIGNLLGQVVALRKGYVGTADGGGDILCHVARHGYVGLRAVVAHGHA